MDEEWKDIQGYEGLYQVSNQGRVRSLDRKMKCSDSTRFYKGKILKPSLNAQGYLFIYLSNKGITKEYRINRLVAEAFLPNPNNYPVVNHIDKNRTNNKVDNLEWCTIEYNNRYSTAKHIEQYDTSGNFVTEWEAISDASRELQINLSNIAQCCMGKRRTAGGYIWKYKEVCAASFF